ncbi:MAG: hypothetical protein AAF934_05730 [Bacteroidota bacterium]
MGVPFPRWQRGRAGFRQSLSPKDTTAIFNTLTLFGGGDVTEGNIGGGKSSNKCLPG